jgi:activating signal cointegrator complex subunit 1
MWCHHQLATNPCGYHLPTQDSAVDATIFQNPQKLHMTIGTLVLLSDKELQQARDLLAQCRQDLVQ